MIQNRDARELGLAYHLAALAQFALLFAKAVAGFVSELATEETAHQPPEVGFEVVHALDQGTPVNLLGGRIVLNAEAVQVFETGEEFLRVADLVDAELELGHVS